MTAPRRRAASPLAPPVPEVAPGTLPERGLREFREALADNAKLRITAPVYWAAFARAFPRHPGGTTERAWLLAALEDAAAHGVITLPPRTGRRWDRLGLPALPTAVDRVREDVAPADERWRTLVWHAALQWVPDLPRLNADEVTFLRRVHTGLVQGAFVMPAPFKHRSLALTGDEKRLAQLVKGKLFDAGRLTLDLIGVQRELPPLAWTVVREVPHPRVLAFENAGPSDLAVRLLSAMPVPTWDVVAYGAGKPFASSVERLTALAPAVLAYVGDLDPDGVAIATAAATTARLVRLPRLVPAPGFHSAMLRAAAALNAPDGWLPDVDKQTRIRSLMTTGSDLAWLPPDVALALRRIALIGRRIPEEALSPSDMAALLASAC